MWPHLRACARLRVRVAVRRPMVGMRRLDGSAEGWSDRERREWLAAFWGKLARYLAKWQGIKMRRGPGENVTFEKAISR